MSLYRASYRRAVPPHYAANPYTRETIEINVLIVHGGTLVVPSSPDASFRTFYEQLRDAYPPLFRRVLSPFGTAKIASASQLTPIKEITQMTLSGFNLPGDAQLYGWEALARETAHRGQYLQLFFQGNGLYFNRGSVLFDGQDLLDYPNAALADFLSKKPSIASQNWMAVSQDSLKRPLLFFVTGSDGRMSCHLHQFTPYETYRQGMRRLKTTFLHRGVRSALAASPPLVIPSAAGGPIYLGLEEILSTYHANDVRHSLYCPYEQTVLLSAELSRAQALQSQALARALGGSAAERIRLPLLETLNYLRPAELGPLLDRKGYANRYSIHQEISPDGAVKHYVLSLSPLEGVYSHLVPFLTRQGQFGVLQTSGTRGNITGNDGPTIRQLSSILRDLNAQPPFDQDPIIAAASGSQGNDVPNLVCCSVSGQPGLLSELCPPAALDEYPRPRGVVTTPRVGIALRI